MTMGSENLSNGSGVTQDRFPSQFAGYHSDRREDLANVEPESGPRNGSVPGQPASGLPSPGVESAGPRDRGPTLPSLDLSLTEPVFSPGTWSEEPARLADHPLLRGLLLELPPKGVVPDAAWLDRWFEAARSILELLYHQDAGRSR